MLDLPTIDTIEISLSLAILVIVLALALRTRSGLRERDNRHQSMQRVILRLEAEQRHFLTAGNLGPLHDKVNEVAQSVAAIGAQQRAQTEQLRVITRHILHQS